MHIDNVCFYGNLSFSYLDIPLLWIYSAAKAKRCRDLGMSGWRQLLPFWGFFILFEKMKKENMRAGMTILSITILLPFTLLVAFFILFLLAMAEPTVPSDLDKGYAIESVEKFLNIEIGEHELILGQYISHFPSPDGQCVYIVKLPDNHIYEQIKNREGWETEVPIEEDNYYLNLCINNAKQYKEIELTMPLTRIHFYDMVYDENEAPEGWVNAFYDIDRNIIYCVFDEC